MMIFKCTALSCTWVFPGETVSVFFSCPRLTSTRTRCPPDVLAWHNEAVAFAAHMTLASGGRGFRLKIGHSDSSPAVHRQAQC
jgi:hypothetical protein